MKKGPLVTAVVTILAMVGVVGAFVSNASPYVTVAQARETSGDRLHLAGALVKESIHTDFKTRTTTFQLKDKGGEIMTVRHEGDAPANMGDAVEVVAIGRVVGDEFVSKELLTKCPSRYEGQEKGKGAQ